MWECRFFLWPVLPGSELTKYAKECPCGEFARAATVYKLVRSNYLWFTV